MKWIALTVLIAMWMLNQKPVLSDADSAPSPKAPQPIALVFGKPVTIHAQSAPVAWRGNDYHLVSLNRIQFTLNSQANQLAAEATAGIQTFDQVDYDISVAVFDIDGKLLGVARTSCHIERLWLGRMVTSSQKLKFDFGASLAYPRAASFMVSISEAKVVTPDEWTKGSGK